MDDRRYPPIEPYQNGTLDVGDGHVLYWEQCGNPDGKPAVVLHGGPGTGCSPGMRRQFDPSRYRIVLFDQRNTGRSTPWAGQAQVDLSTNTTPYLIHDIEALREHLGIQRWLVWGGSWGVTLGLAYAQAHPERVSELALAAITSPDRWLLRWITRDMGRVFPREWERFRDHVPAEQREGDLAAAYARLLQSPDGEVRTRAAQSWCEWEDTHVSLTPGAAPSLSVADRGFQLAFARLVTHYWSNGCFLEDGQLLREAHRLAGIHGVMVHGRYDVSGPLHIAWQLAKAWPEGELVVVEDAGHGGSALTAAAVGYWTGSRCLDVKQPHVDHRCPHDLGWLASRGGCRRCASHAGSLPGQRLADHRCPVRGTLERCARRLPVVVGCDGKGSTCNEVGTVHVFRACERRRTP